MQNGCLRQQQFSAGAARAAQTCNATAADATPPHGALSLCVWVLKREEHRADDAEETLGLMRGASTQPWCPINAGHAREEFSGSQKVPGMERGGGGLRACTTEGGEAARHRSLELSKRCAEHSTTPPTKTPRRGRRSGRWVRGAAYCDRTAPRRLGSGATTQWASRSLLLAASRGCRRERKTKAPAREIRGEHEHGEGCPLQSSLMRGEGGLRVGNNRQSLPPPTPSPHQHTHTHPVWRHALQSCFLCCVVAARENKHADNREGENGEHVPRAAMARCR